MLYATRKIILHDLSSDEKTLLKQLCVLSKDVYNQSIKILKSIMLKLDSFYFGLIITNLLRKHLHIRKWEADFKP